MLQFVENLVLLSIIKKIKIGYDFTTLFHKLTIYNAAFCCTPYDFRCNIKYNVQNIQPMCKYFPYAVYNIACV